MNILVPCSLLAENILSVFRSPHLPLDTSRKAGFPFATRARKREPCPQKYVSRMIRTENFLSQIFFKVFLETTFLHVLWYPVHYWPKIFFRFFEVRTLHSAPTTSFKPLYTNKKVQLQLDFLISPAVAGLFLLFQL